MAKHPILFAETPHTRKNDFPSSIPAEIMMAGWLGDRADTSNSGVISREAFLCAIAADYDTPVEAFYQFIWRAFSENA